MAGMMKITAFDAITTASDDDALYVIDDADGTPASRKITVGNLRESLFPAAVLPNVDGFSTVTTVAQGDKVVLADSTLITVANLFIAMLAGETPVQTLAEDNPLTVTVGTTAGASTEIDVTNYRCGSFQLPSDSGTTEVTVYSQLGTEDYGIATDDDNGPLVLPVTAGRPRPLPPNLNNYSKIKLVASAGTATADVPVIIKG